MRFKSALGMLIKSCPEVKHLAGGLAVGGKQAHHGQHGIGFAGATFADDAEVSPRSRVKLIPLTALTKTVLES